MRRLPHAVTAIASAMLLGLVVALPVEATGPGTQQSFAERVAEAKLVALVRVQGTPATGFVLTVDRIFKGQAGPRLVYPPPQPITALEPGWTRVVIAFDNPTELDFRAGNIVWHVAPDGQIDPEGFQRFPGLPPTLAAMIAYFGVPETSTDPRNNPAGPHWPGVVLVIALSYVGGMLAFRRFLGRRGTLV